LCNFSNAYSTTDISFSSFGAVRVVNHFNFKKNGLKVFLFMDIEFFKGNFVKKLKI
jgi:hypothetical protein